MTGTNDKIVAPPVDVEAMARRIVGDKNTHSERFVALAQAYLDTRPNPLPSDDLVEARWKLLVVSDALKSMTDSYVGLGETIDMDASQFPMVVRARALVEGDIKSAGKVTALVSCQDEACAMETSYHLDMVRMFLAAPICEGCYGEGYRREDDPAWNDLPPVTLGDLCT